MGCLPTVRVMTRRTSEMTGTILDSLLEQLDSLLPHRRASRCCLALSGGIDSAVLLDALATLRARCPELELRALHVDHGLDPSAHAWADEARAMALAAGVPCDVMCVDVQRQSALGLEAASREARHAAFRDALRDGEVLVTAHHADDQLETLLLALLRGSGVKGLASMPALAPFARGWHWRPMLARTRAELETVGRERGLSWLDDPANLELRHDRNYLRHVVVPLMKARWPHAADSASRAAALLAEAGALLDSVALEDLRHCAVGACLDVARLGSLTPDRRRLLLRLWLQLRGVRLPSQRRLQAVLRDLQIAAPDRHPAARLTPDVSLRRYRGLLYLVRDLGPPPRADATFALHPGDVLELPADSGRLFLQASSAAAHGSDPMLADLSVRFRTPGERVRVAGSRHSTAVKELLRAHHVLPWMRDRVPLVFQRDRLVAIGDRTLPGAAACCPALAASLRWERGARWRALD